MASQLKGNMIYSDKYKYVYIATPKTASTSIRKWLMDNYDGRQVGRHHQSDVPSEYREYFIFTSTRNPVDRYHSMWKEFYPSLQYREFREAIQGIRESADQNRTWADIARSQGEIIERSGATRLLRFEDIKSEVESLPFADKEFDVHLRRRTS